MAYAEPVNMTGLQGIFEYANNVSDGVFGVGILISLYVIIFAYLSSRGTESTSSFVVAGFITSIAAVLLFILGLIGNWHLFAIIFLTAVGLIWGYFNKS